MNKPELNINKAVEHTLLKLETSVKRDVIEELIDDEKFEVLQETKDILFNFAKSIYEDQLVRDGILHDGQQANIKPIKRAKTSLLPIATDVVELYEYVTGMSEQFPKSVVSGSSTLYASKTHRHLDTATEEQIHAEAAVNAVLDKAKLIEAMTMIQDQKQLIIDLAKRVEDNKAKIDSLSSELENLKKNGHASGNPKPQAVHREKNTDCRENVGEERNQEITDSTNRQKENEIKDKSKSAATNTSET